MPFPIHPPKQMPCPHWNHFPISPVDTNPPSLVPSSSDEHTQAPGPVSYRYCVYCKKSVASNVGAAGGDVEDKYAA